MEIHNILLPFRKYHIPDLGKTPEEIREFVLKINAEIVRSKYRMEIHRCLCGSEDFDLVASTDRHGFITPVSVCRQCGLVSINPGYSEIFYKDLRSNPEYFEIFHQSTDARDYALKNFTPVAGQSIFSVLKSFITITKNTKVLEIEAGAGWNLIPFRQAGAQVTGIDTNQELCLWGQKTGFNIINTDVENFSTDEKFDLIILSEVIHKISSPLDYIIKSLNLAADKAIIYIDLPLYNPGKINFSLAQRYYFTTDTFKYFMAEANLIPLEIEILQNKIAGVFKKGIYQNSKFLLQRNRKNTYKALNKIKRKNLFLLSKKIHSRDEIVIFKILEKKD